jgi:three-Cys-motif partner protein
VDLIYLFPEGMSVKRNMDKFLAQSHSPLDEALGTDTWRERVRIHRGLDRLGRWEAVGRPIVEALQEQLRSLGYVDVGNLGSEVEIRNTKKVPLYYLVFASKHATGHEFWRKAIAIHPDGQRHLPF